MRLTTESSNDSTVRRVSASSHPTTAGRISSFISRKSLPNGRAYSRRGRECPRVRCCRPVSTHWLLKESSRCEGVAPFGTRLAGAGRHLPPTHLTTAELMARTRHNTRIDLERLTGIRERRISAGDEDSYSLATSAARDCLSKAHQDASTLDVVISCSITKFNGGLTQWLEPSMSSAIAKAIGADKAMTFDVSNACAGMLTGVTILNNWIRP